MIQLDLTKDPEQLLADHFDGLHSGGPRSDIRGGQTAANAALANLDLTGYAKNRSQVLPLQHRGATEMSPYVRHNLITLPQLWQAASVAPKPDRDKYQDELLWQEYARHLYARVGTRLFDNLRFRAQKDAGGEGWPAGMACVDSVLDELHQRGWLVNQTRMWLASHWTVRNGAGWIHGQERMFQQLIDGSRAANLLGWQWTVGSGTGKPYGFARWQVEKRAPELCGTCPLKRNCPIEQFPVEQQLTPMPAESLLAADPNPQATAGPKAVVETATPKFVLLTVESLGDHDPALVANPQLPAVFVFNRDALAKLKLSAKRLYFYLETVADLASRRETLVYLGDPVQFAAQNPAAVTYAPVPSFQKFQNLAQVHPYPWLRQPHGGSVKSFSAWRDKLR